jgi:hypothetical protein
MAEAGGIIPGTCEIPACLSDGTCGTRSICRQGELCCDGVCRPLGSLCILPGL